MIKAIGSATITYLPISCRIVSVRNHLNRYLSYTDEPATGLLTTTIWMRLFIMPYKCQTMIEPRPSSLNILKSWSPTATFVRHIIIFINSRLSNEPKTPDSVFIMSGF